jgi:hypothetical protein
MLVQKIKYIDLVLENCDYYRIDQEDVICVDINGIYTHAGINIVGQFWENKVARLAVITLINKDYLTKWEQETSVPIIGFKERLSHKDITGISIGTPDGEFFYYIEAENQYPEDSMNFKNIWQENEFDDDVVVIKICKPID